METTIVPVLPRSASACPPPCRHCGQQHILLSDYCSDECYDEAATDQQRDMGDNEPARDERPASWSDYLPLDNWETLSARQSIRANIGVWSFGFAPWNDYGFIDAMSEPTHLAGVFYADED